MSDRLIVNASPLIFLGNAGRLEILRHLGAGRVVVPEAVRSEVVSSSHADRASAAVADATWIETVPPVAIIPSVAVWDLDAGEAQVIGHALESRPNRLVLDDLAGRRCALSHGLVVGGTIGVIVEAHRHGLVEDPRAVLEELRDAGMWLSDALLERAMQLAGLT